MAAGMPLVTTDQGAIADTVADGEAGFVLDDADPERLAECVLRLLEDDDLRRCDGPSSADALSRPTSPRSGPTLAWRVGSSKSPRPSRKYGRAPVVLAEDA